MELEGMSVEEAMDASEDTMRLLPMAAEHVADWEHYRHHLIRDARSVGVSFRKIAAASGLSVNTVRKMSA